ncbi:MAG: hypothetical protein WKF73_09645 [Nocardioidaceae bacterium]
MDSAEYRRCVDAYGWDPLTWSGFRAMRAIRELEHGHLAPAARRRVARG